MVVQIALESYIGWVSDRVWKIYNCSAVNSSKSSLLYFTVTSSGDDPSQASKRNSFELVYLLLKGDSIHSVAFYPEVYL